MNQSAGSFYIFRVSVCCQCCRESFETKFHYRGAWDCFPNRNKYESRKFHSVLKLFINSYGTVQPCSYVKNSLS